MERNDAVKEPTVLANLESTEVQSKGLIKTLWCGEAPLVITYWLFGFVASVAIIVISREILSVTSNKLIHLMMLIFIVGYQVFASVSTWRASNKYKGKRGFAVLAQVAVLLGWLSAIPQIILAFFRAAA